MAFEKLNVICQELENRQRRALPVVEREALFSRYVACARLWDSAMMTILPHSG